MGEGAPEAEGYTNKRRKCCSHFTHEMNIQLLGGKMITPGGRKPQVDM
jgi:hypothetical protein